MNKKLFYWRRQSALKSLHSCLYFIDQRAPSHQSKNTAAFRLTSFLYIIYVNRCLSVQLAKPRNGGGSGADCDICWCSLTILQGWHNILQVFYMCSAEVNKKDTRIICGVKSLSFSPSVFFLFLSFSLACACTHAHSHFSCFQLNPNVNSFQRKFVGEVRRCEEMEKTFGEFHLHCRFPHRAPTSVSDSISNARPSLYPPTPTPSLPGAGDRPLPVPDAPCPSAAAPAHPTRSAAQRAAHHWGGERETCSWAQRGSYQDIHNHLAEDLLIQGMVHSV